MSVLETLLSNLTNLTSGDALWIGLILLLLALIIILVFPGIKRIKIWIAGTGVEVERTSSEKPTEKTGIKSAGEVKAGGAVIGQQEISKVRDIYQGPTTIIQQAPPELEERVRQLEETVRGLSPSPPKEEIEKQMYALHLTAKNLENSRLHLELGLERLEDKRYEEAIKNLEEALRPLPEDSEATASVLWNLGIALIEWPRGDRLNNLTKAVEAYKKVIKIYTIEKSPESFAGVQNNLGEAYRSLSEVRDKEDNLGPAIEAYNEALRVYTFERFPQYYAMTQNNLGNAYRGLSEVRDKEVNLGLAIKSYNEALRVYTFDKFPQDYAMTQNNRGNAYGGLSEVRDKEANLKRAIDCYKEALRVRTFEGFPQDYATTQNNLGTAYCGLSEVRDKEDNLGPAIEAYKEALRVYTFEGFPQYYATTQNNLGAAYGNLSGVRDMEDNIGRAIQCFKEALKVRKKESLPWYFVETSKNLAVALSMKGDIAVALKVMKEMLPVAEEVRHPGLEDYRRFYEGLKSDR